MEITGSDVLWSLWNFWQLDALSQLKAQKVGFTFYYYWGAAAGVWPT